MIEFLLFFHTIEMVLLIVVLGIIADKLNK